MLCTLSSGLIHTVYHCSHTHAWRWHQQGWSHWHWMNWHHVLPSWILDVFCCFVCLSRIRNTKRQPIGNKARDTIQANRTDYCHVHSAPTYMTRVCGHMVTQKNVRNKAWREVAVIVDESGMYCICVAMDTRRCHESTYQEAAALVASHCVTKTCFVKSRLWVFVKWENKDIEELMKSSVVFVSMWRLEPLFGLCC